FALLGGSSGRFESDGLDEGFTAIGFPGGAGNLSPGRIAEGCVPVESSFVNRRHLVFLLAGLEQTLLGLLLREFAEVAHRGADKEKPGACAGTFPAVAIVRMGGSVPFDFARIS